MLIAMLISGRIDNYYDLKKILDNSTEHIIHLFLSINDDYEENKIFYDNFKDLFKKYIKQIYIKKYVCYDNFINTNIDTINNGNVYLKTLSCFYNDNNCFKLADEFENMNSINYELFVRYRSDIISDSLPNFNNYDKNILYVVKPFNYFTLAITDNPKGEYKNERRYCYGNTKYDGKYVTGDIAYGSKELMKIYCNCYDYIIEQNEINNGNYFICFEYNLTTYLYDSNVNFLFFDFDYKYNTDRFIKQ